MYDAVSPYALLCLSRPQRAPTIVTPYDLYSQTVRGAMPSSGQSVPSVSSQPIGLPPPAPGPSAVRTHYICDIHKKHGAAEKRATFTPLR